MLSVQSFATEEKFKDVFKLADPVVLNRVK